MSELASWLLEQIAADEEAARAALSARFSWASVGYNGWEAEEHGRRHDPARVLADCEALRAVVAKVERAEVAFGQMVNPASSAAVMALTEVLQILAQPFAGRPGWDGSWRMHGHKEAQA